MNSWVGDQIGLELGHVHVKSSVESQRGGQRRDHLSDQSVEVGVGWSLDVEVSSANVVNGLIVQHNGNVGVF